MKTNRIALILLAGAALMLSSCDNREKDFEIPTFGDDEVAFKIGLVQTRSMAINQSETLQLGAVKSDGRSFIFEDEVTSLDFASDDLATRGTPAFTENVKALYSTFYTVAMNANTGAYVFEKNKDLVNGVEYTNEKDNIWHYRYGEDIWGEGKLPTYFFMRMPGTAAGVDLGESPYNRSTGSITFNYTSPSAAADQKDILFTSYKRTGETNCEDITFFHALTGVKFSNYFDNKAREKADDDDEDFNPKTTRTYIKKVTINGLKNQGTCTITPDFSKTSKDVVKWTDVSGKANFTITLGDTPNDTTNYEGSDYGLYTLLNANAISRNLNDKNGSLTFWFIPQDLTQTATDSVTVEVTFDVMLDDEKTFENVVVKANLSKLLTANHRVWTAGQLHTFTLRPTKVGVKIDDDLDEYVKSDVVVENTGNVWQYVRVNMVGNWWGNLWKENDEDGNPVYYTDSTILAGFAGPEGPEETLGWNDKDGKTHYGEFVNLVEESSTDDPVVNSHGWVRFDKYWYYTKPLGPGDSVSDTFFDSYTVGASPEFWIADVFGVRHAAGNVHLLMDLMVQSIEAPMTEDGEEITDYMHAWAAALGYGDDVSALDDL